MIVKELVTRLGFQLDKTGLKDYEKSVDKIKHIGSRVFEAFLVYEVAEAFHSMAEYAEQVSIASEKLGVSADDVQKLKYAANQANVEFESLVGSMSIFSTKLQEAKKGNKDASEAFSNILGGSFDPNSVKDVHEFFLEIADKISKMGSAIEKNAALRAVFGRQGISLLPFFNKGRAGIEESEKEGVALFSNLDDEQREAGEHFEHNWKSIASFITNSIRQITSSIAPAINSITDSIIEFLKENHDAISDGFKELAVVGKVIFDLIGGSLSLVSRIWKILASIFKSIREFLGETISRLGLFAAIAGLIAGSFLEIPAVIALIASAIDDVITYFQGGKKTVTGLIIAQIEDKLIPAIKRVGQNLEDAFFNTKIGKFISQIEHVYDVLMGISELHPFQTFGGNTLSTSPAASVISPVLHFNQNVTVNGTDKDPKEIADAIKEHGSSGMQEYFDSMLRQTIDVFGTSDNSLPLAR